MNGSRGPTPGKHGRPTAEPPTAEPSGPAEPLPAAEPPTLPDRPTDENDEAWGDFEGPGGRDRSWYERERPPHHE